MIGRAKILLGLITSLGVGASLAFAQSTSTTPNSGPSVTNPETPGGEAVALSPFVVNSSNDTGYVTNQSLSGSRFSQNLYDTPASISVITAAMMKDMGAFNLQEAMAWSVNSIASDVGDTSSSDATGFSDAERRNITVNIRGIQTTVARNFFKWSINSDAYNVERIDTSRGPNALLAGASSLAGLSNITTKQAIFRNQATVGAAIQSVGGLRGTIDINQVLIKNKLALRVNAFKEDIDTWRDYGNVKNQAVSLAGTWKVNDSFTIRFEGEKGNSESVLPKTAIRDFTDSWDHFTLATSTVGTAAQRTAANNAVGVAAETATTSYIDIFRPDLGAVNWGGKVITTGDGAYLKTFCHCRSEHRSNPHSGPPRCSRLSGQQCSQFFPLRFGISELEIWQPADGSLGRGTL